MVIVSAPGKILLAGGYLVLDDENCGLVVAVNRRFYCQCKVQQLSEATNHNNTHIRVQSPQFNGQEWQYTWNEGRIQADISNATANGFVEKTLRVVLSYLSATTDGSKSLANKEIHLKLAADNDFYSLVPHLKQRNLSLNNGNALPKCLPAARENGSILKTGLGSSACLVTAIVAAILKSFVNVTTETTCALAQVSHCYAQGKVGSGFDVSAACYGSHVYQRFPKAILSNVLKALDGTEMCGALIQAVVNDNQSLGCGVQRPIRSFRATSFLQVMMADVSMGSESPSMARTILKWKDEQSPPVPYWTDLAKLNPKVIELLSQLDDCLYEDDAKAQFAATPAKDWPRHEASFNVVAKILLDLRDTFGEIRRNLKGLGDSAKVPVEPNLQTALCDATETLPGVLATLVPGAGGYDAVACIYINETSVRDTVANFWANGWKEGTVCALTVSGSNHGEGLKVEEEFPTMIEP